jgi:hypothetical protein
MKISRPLLAAKGDKIQETRTARTGKSHLVPDFSRGCLKIEISSAVLFVRLRAERQGEAAQKRWGSLPLSAITLD